MKCGRLGAGQGALRPAHHRPIERLTDLYGEDAIAHADLACATEQPFDIAPSPERHPLGDDRERVPRLASSHQT